MSNAPRPHSLAATLVETAMHHGVIVCSRDDALSRVASLMSGHDVHSVVVNGEAGGLWGIVSDLDLVAAAAVRDLDEQTAGGTAATPVVAVAPRDSLLRAAQLMTEYGVAHLVVVEPETGRPVGVLSTLDVARTITETETAREETLQQTVARSSPARRTLAWPGATPQPRVA
jgi:CBS domain-containing protein